MHVSKQVYYELIHYFEYKTDVWNMNSCVTANISFPGYTQLQNFWAQQKLQKMLANKDINQRIIDCC